MSHERECLPELARAYELGVINFSEYYTDQFDKVETLEEYQKAQKKVDTYIDKFFNRGLSAFVPPSDKHKIDDLADILRGRMAK